MQVDAEEEGLLPQLHRMLIFSFEQNHYSFATISRETGTCMHKHFSLQ